MEYESSSFESEQGSDSEAVVQPFMYEPVTTAAGGCDGSSNSESDSDNSIEAVSVRLLNLDWYYIECT